MPIKPIQKLTAALLLCGAFGTANAASIALQPGTVDAEPSEVITFDIMYDFRDEPTLGGGFDVFFDSSVLTFLDYSYANPAAGDFGFARDPDVGDGILTGIAFGNFNGIGNADIVGTLTFVVNPLAAGGTTSITMADNNLPAGPFLNLGTFQPISVDYSGADVNVNVGIIPVPAALWLMLGGLGAMLRFRRIAA